MSDFEEKPITEKTSRMMSRIKGQNTKPEMLVRQFLFKAGFRYRLHYKQLPGSPDIVLPKYKTAIFVHGCFWHGHEGCYKPPTTRADFWARKVTRNRARDGRNKDDLENLGWRVLVIYECELKKKEREATFTKVADYLNGLKTLPKAV